jgi:hypothetical protein
LQLN